MKLFMIYVGGSFKNSNIELHDVRFSIGETVEDCYPDLRTQWWGDPESLHLDCWGEVTQVDGFDVTLTQARVSETDDRIFFVNLGGGRTDEFTEIHRNLLVIAPNEKAAQAKALAQVKGWTLPHKDFMFDVGKAVDVSQAMERQGYYLQLTKASAKKPFDFFLSYVPIAGSAVAPPGIPVLSGRI